MIASLQGRVQAVLQNCLVVEVQGIGFRIYVPSKLLNGNCQTGEELRLHTYLHVRDNELSLYGFSTVDERELFELALSVNGIGPRTALALVSAFSPEALRDLIAREDVSGLAQIPGIGTKTARRLLLDLKDKVAPSAASSAVYLQDKDADVINALTALGYSVAEARQAIAAIPGDLTELDERIMAALRHLGSA